MLKAKESSLDLDWGQAMANGAVLEWMGRQDVAPQVMLTSYLSSKDPELHRLTQMWSCCSFVGRCCGCALDHAVGAMGWQRLSEDTGDTVCQVI